MPHLGRLPPPGDRKQREWGRQPRVWACLLSALLADLTGGGAQEDTGWGLQRGGVRTHSLEEGRRGNREKLPTSHFSREECGGSRAVGQEWGGGTEAKGQTTEGRAQKPPWTSSCPHTVGSWSLSGGICHPHPVGPQRGQAAQNLLPLHPDLQHCPPSGPGKLAWQGGREGTH